MALTYKVIQSQEIGSGGIGQLTLNSIPSTYDDLVVFISMRGTGSFNTGTYAVQWQFNNTTSNRSGRRWYTVSGNPTGQDTAISVGIIPGANSAANAFAGVKIYIPDYKNTSRAKPFIADSIAPGDSSNYEIDRQVELWDDSSAISRIDFTVPVGNFAQYTTITLIGISKS